MQKHEAREIVCDRETAGFLDSSFWQPLDNVSEAGRGGKAGGRERNLGAIEMIQVEDGQQLIGRAAKEWLRGLTRCSRKRWPQGPGVGVRVQGDASS